jgi:hypothetical protein
MREAFRDRSMTAIPTAIDVGQRRLAQKRAEFVAVPAVACIVAEADDVLGFVHKSSCLVWFHQSALSIAATGRSRFRPIPFRVEPKIDRLCSPAKDRCDVARG